MKKKSHLPTLSSKELLMRVSKTLMEKTPTLKKSNANVRKHNALNFTVTVSGMDRFVERAVNVRTVIIF
jgi:hypothetical protein